MWRPILTDCLTSGLLRSRTETSIRFSNLPALMLQPASHGMAKLLLSCTECTDTNGLLTQQICVFRIAPHVTMTLVALEALKAYEKKIGL